MSKWSGEIGGGERENRSGEIGGGERENRSGEI